MNSTYGDWSKHAVYDMGRSYYRGGSSAKKDAIGKDYTRA